MIDLKRGDQVVCLKDKWTLRFGKYEGCLPIANNVYTVTNVIRGRDDDIYINLAEFQRGKPGFTASAFRKVPLVDWSQPVWTIHDHRAATVIATNFRFRDRDEDLVLLIPTNPGQWGDPSPLVRTHAGDYVKDPWRTQSASALKFENIPIEKVTILGHITPANVDTTGEANVRLVFENGQLKDAQCLA